MTAWCVRVGLKDCPRGAGGRDAVQERASEPGASAHLTRARLGSADSRWSPPLGPPRVHPARRCSRGVPGAPGEGRASRTDPPPVPCGQPAGGQGARCEREQHVVPPARVHPDLCRLWLGFVPWPRRGRQGNVACAGPIWLSGPGAAGGCRLWCGVLSPHGLPECALSLLDLFAPPGQRSVATAPHPARDADGQAPGHRRAAARRTGHPERLRCRPGSCDRCGTGARKGAALGGRAGAAPFSVLRARSLSEVFSREGGRSVTTSVSLTQQHRVELLRGPAASWAPVSKRGLAWLCPAVRGV